MASGFPVEIVDSNGFPVNVINKAVPLYDGRIRNLFPTMASPPTITIGKTTTSAVDATKINGAVTVSSYDSRIQLTHSIFENADTDLSKAASDITLSTGSKVSAFAGARFATDAPAFEVCFHETNGVRMNILVDGEFAYRSEQIRFANSGNRRYIKFDFGTNVTTYSKSDASVGITAGGSGYVVGDIITLNGGTNSAGGTPCTIVVAQVSGGAVTIASVLNKGAYTTLPTGTFSQTSTTGTGTGFQCTAQFFGRNHSTKKMRNIEILYNGGRFFGVVTTADDVVLPYKINQLSPKLVIVGDSQNAGTYYDYAGSQMGYRIAQRLGMTDKLVISAQGGTGWNQDNGTALKWSSSQRINDLIAHQGDIYLFIGSQNDTANPTLTTVVTSTLNQLRNVLPNAYFIGVGPVIGNSEPITAAIKNGFLAANKQDRTVFIDNVTTNPWFTTAKFNTYWTETSDTAHLNQDGVNAFADIVSNHVSETLVNMIKTQL